jgi:hypothetical protein
MEVSDEESENTDVESEATDDEGDTTDIEDDPDEDSYIALAGSRSPRCTRIWDYRPDSPGG